MKMFTVYRRRKLKISNTLAAIAALLLIASTLAGINNSLSTDDAPALDKLNSEAAVTDPLHDASGEKGKGHKMSLFLFRHR
jgi:ABC-type branched-subunit amino acid transport system ATPase component